MSRAFAVVNVSVIPGDAAGTVLPRHTVVVGPTGTIERIGPSDEIAVPTGYRVLDRPGHYLIPGLINAHAHLFSDGKPLPAILTNKSIEDLVSKYVLRGPIGRRLMAKRTRTNVATQMNSGITTIRSVGDVGYEVVAERDAIDRGDHLGPRLLASGPLLAIPGGHGAPQIALVNDTPEAARANARINLRHRVDTIKISATAGVTDAVQIGYAGRPEMTGAQIAAVCEEAHNAGVLVAAHAQSAEGILMSLRAGVDTIEHGSGMTPEMVELYLDNPRSLRGWSAVIPTLQACIPLVALDRSITGIDEVVHANAEMILEEMLTGIRDATAHGVTLGVGTDSALTYVPHYAMWRELDLLVEYGGLTTAQVLHAATQVNARILGVDEVTGAVEAGRVADLVILAADPLADFRALAQPETVVVRGHLVENPRVTRFPELDRQLDTVHRR